MKTFFIAGAALLVLAFMVMTASYSQPAQENNGASVVKVVMVKGHGSGFYIGNGLVVTAAHVVADAPNAKIKLANDEEIDGEVLWSNKARDIALIKVGPNAFLKPARLRCSSPEKGDLIYAEGNPLNLEFVTVWGSVAAEARTVGPWLRAFITDIVVVPGQSGGPVYNLNDEVVGMTVGVMLMPMGFSASIVGIGYAVPASEICALIGR